MREQLWSGLGLFGPLKARASGALASGVGGVSIDTRTLEPGDLFFAIKGDASDGHDYVRAAFEKGAAAAVIDEAHADALAGSGPLYVVRDTLAAMRGLGAAARERSQARIIAVTGSAGKTSTKEALRTVLSKFGATHASAASYNNHWGVPLSLARMPATARFGVFEIGMNHAGEITPLVDMVRPHVAVITTVEPVHIGNFPDGIVGIAEAKAEILKGLVPGGTAALPRDNPHFPLLRERANEVGAKILTFGFDPEAEVRCIQMDTGPRGSSVIAGFDTQRFSYKIGAPGEHYVRNSLAVLAVVLALRADAMSALKALSRVVAPAGRGERTLLQGKAGSVLLVDESFNANPASVRAALAALGMTPRADHPRRIAVLGDMLEIGAASPDVHRALKEAVDASGADLVFACGPMMRLLFEALDASKQGAWAETSTKLVAPLLERLQSGDVVMIKGSRGTRMAPIVEAVRQRFGSDPGGD